MHEADARPTHCSSLQFASTILLLSAAFPLSSYAQSTYATLQGTVLDASGALVPNATVTATDEGTGTKETVRATSGGDYRIFDLKAGTYTIVFSSPGFGDQQLTHQVVLARQVLSLDAHLTAGTVATEVAVTDQALTSDVATVSHSLSSADIDTLALNFRATDNTSPLYVATLTPRCPD